MPVLEMTMRLTRPEHVSLSRQRNESNAAATRDAVRRAEEFFARHLK
jgi:hypothetical protein